MTKKILGVLYEIAAILWFAMAIGIYYFLNNKYLAITMGAMGIYNAVKAIDRSHKKKVELKSCPVKPDEEKNPEDDFTIVALQATFCIIKRIEGKKTAFPKEIIIGQRRWQFDKPIDSQTVRYIISGKTR